MEMGKYMETNDSRHEAGQDMAWPSSAIYIYIRLERSDVECGDWLEDVKLVMLGV